MARAMLAAAPHRGACMTIRVLGNCILGVANRPDQQDAGVSSDGPTIGVLSGRIDNSAELAREASAAGVVPLTPADADVAVAAIQAFGPDAPNRMRGCFAGIISDGSTLRCFRDHIGFRPLFYRDDPNAFIAASEARQVVVGARIVEEPDLDVMLQILFGKMPADTPAALKGVSRLSQGSTLMTNGRGGFSVSRYWHPADLLETSRLSPVDLRDRFTELMAQAAARTVTGNDAVLLSGGVDSPAVAAFAAPEHRRRSGKALGALSAVFPDLPAVDELPLIELVAQHFGIELHTYRPQARALDDVDRWCRLFGSPVPILSVPEIFDSHARAGRLGYQNVLTGDFAEFVFGSPMHLAPHLVTHGRWRSLATLLRSERRRGRSRRWLAGQVLATFVPGRLANQYLRWRRLDIPERIPDWLDAARVYQLPFRGDFLPPARERWNRVQLAGVDGSTIMMEADEICSRLTGVTVRRPFADIDLWEFFLGLRAEVKFPDHRFKTLVRGFLRGHLPDQILDRRRKTLFDDHVMTQIDYPTLKRLLIEPRHRLPAVDYRRLAGRLERQDFNRYDWHWAQDLARIHAFLGAW